MLLAFQADNMWKILLAQVFQAGDDKLYKERKESGMI